MRRCLNVGCGRRPSASTEHEVWTNLDVAAGPGVDVVRDVRRGLPFSDETFDHVLIDNVLEHFPSEDAIFVLNEISRVLVDGGTARIIVPHFQSEGAVQDPTHSSFWSPRSCLYWHSSLSRYGGPVVGLRGDLAPTRVEVWRGHHAIDEIFITFDVLKRDADFPALDFQMVDTTGGRG